MLILDTSAYERQLFSTGLRSLMTDAKTGKPRAQGSTLSLGNMLLSLRVDVQCTLHNSGNDAFMCLVGLQKLLDPEHTVAPVVRGRATGNGGRAVNPRIVSRSPVGLPTLTLPAADGNRVSSYSLATSTSLVSRAPSISPQQSPVERLGASTAPYFDVIGQPSSKVSPRNSEFHLEPRSSRLVVQQGNGSGKNSRRSSLNAEALLGHSMESMALR